MSWPTPDYERDGVRLYRGDCLELLPQFPAGAFDAVVTDPPYSSGGAFRGDRASGSAGKYAPHTSRHYADFAGDNRDQRAYGYWCALWLGAALIATRPAGVAAVFTDWRQLPTASDSMQAGGWVWRGIVVWDKTEAARPAKGRFRNQCEYVVWGSRGSMGSEVGEAGDGVDCLPGLFRKAVVGLEKHHVAQKPAEVMQGIVGIAGPGGMVLDPFMGSGSTGLACVATGRQFVGVELDPHHFATATKRFDEAFDSLALFVDLPKPEQGALFCDSEPA